MNEWFKKLIGKIADLWGRWSMVQRAILVGIVVAAAGGVVALFSVSGAPTMVPVIDAPIRDEAARDRIVLRINQEGIKVQVNSSDIIQVPDENSARRMRAILIREDLVPAGTDPWAIFDRERWTITDFERNVNLQRAIRQMITDHIRAIDDVDDANVTIVMPARELFREDQNPVTASVIIIPKPGSDITENHKKVEGIQKILKFAIEGLKDENIVITDQGGLVLNDFDGMADFERLGLIEKEMKLVQTQEAKYKALVLAGLQKTFTADRVRDINVKIDMDMSKKAVATDEFFPVTMRPRTPGLPYDDSELVPSVTLSQSTSSTVWEGTGFNPEGPSGVEGQTPPAFKDMSNLFGRMTQNTNVHNEAINKRTTQEERSPQTDRITVAVNIDGTWKWKYDEKGNPLVLPDGTIEREYIPVPAEQLRGAQVWVQNAVGYSAGRGDSVTVQNIPYDRTAQFIEEDAAYFRKKQIQTTIVVFLSGLALLLVSFILFRTISRELERRRRLAEDERSRREQAIRESAIEQAEEGGVDVSISVEERTRMELQEAVANMAKEHPEDCAQLIRTWLLEE
ncbi:MAG: flagellar M-ring protein FliF [Treponema sp.]|jgi:flagellar M-ring protein FliF|nr:flagellar M-ring protein FliF [Treponema sp.]